MRNSMTLSEWGVLAFGHLFWGGDICLGRLLNPLRTGVQCFSAVGSTSAKLQTGAIPFGVGNPGVGTFHLQNTEIGVEDVLDHHLMALADRWHELGN